MGLIIDRKIRALMTGYPTVSDKYNAKGGILEANSTDTDANFGDVLIYGSTPGYYKPATSGITAATMAGILLGTNVKLSGIWPDSSEGAITKAGESFNLLLDGFIAVKLASTVDTTKITEGAAVYVTPAGGFTDSTDSTTGKFAYRNAVYTGIVENHGTTAAPVYVAEIWVK